MIIITFVSILSKTEEKNNQEIGLFGTQKINVFD